MDTQSNALTQQAAVRVAGALGGAHLAWISGHAIDGPASAGAYVRLACEALADRGAWIAEDGELHLDGSAEATPEQSGERVTALGNTKGPGALAPIDEALKAALSRERRAALLIETVYATDRTLTLGIADAPKASEGDSLEGMPPEMAEQMRKLMAEHGDGESRS